LDIDTVNIAEEKKKADAILEAAIPILKEAE
jgi:hypothetical protein